LKAISERDNAVEPKVNTKIRPMKSVERNGFFEQRSKRLVEEENQTNQTKDFVKRLK